MTSPKLKTPWYKLHLTEEAYSHELVTQPMIQRRPNPRELRSMDSYVQILCRFQKSKQKVPPLRFKDLATAMSCDIELKRTMYIINVKGFPALLNNNELHL